MTSVSDIVSAVGRAKLRLKLGVSDTAISNALARRVFPSKWYRVIARECEGLEVECPLDLFNFAADAEELAEADEGDGAPNLGKEDAA